MRKATIDIPLAIVVFCLVIFGIIMISSVSVYESYQLTSNMVSQGLRAEPSNSFYLWRHFWRALLSIPIWIFAIYFPLKFWKKAALPFFVITILLLIALFLPGIGANYGTSTSWINLPFLPSVQPAEMAKLGLIFYLAVWMEKRQELVRSFQYGLIPFTILLSSVVILLAMQPDFGSVLVISVIAASMFFCCRRKPHSHYGRRFAISSNGLPHHHEQGIPSQSLPHLSSSRSRPPQHWLSDQTGSHCHRKWRSFWCGLRKVHSEVWLSARSTG